MLFDVSFIGTDTSFYCLSEFWILRSVCTGEQLKVIKGHLMRLLMGCKFAGLH